MDTCVKNPCIRYDDDRCCFNCLDDECEFICGYMDAAENCEYKGEKE